MSTFLLAIALHETTGLVVPPEDAPSLAAAITRLAQNDDERVTFGTAARNRAEQEFGLEQMIERTEAVYSALLAA